MYVVALAASAVVIPKKIMAQASAEQALLRIALARY